MKAILQRIYRLLVPQSLRYGFRITRELDQFTVVRNSDWNYAEDNLYTYNSAPFLQDERFLRAYQLGESTQSWPGSTIRWRAYIACWAGQQAAHLPGDFVECGVNRGGLARAIVDYIDFQHLSKRFFLIDNFMGLVPEYLNAAEREKNLLEHYAYYEQNSQEEVSKTFSAFANVQVIKGNVPDILEDVPSDRFAFVSLDMNCTFPEIEAAKFFWDRIVSGGIILLDDYTQTMHSEQQIAFDQFARERGVGVLALPTGQGLLLKP